MRGGLRALLDLAAPLAGVQLAQVALTTTDVVMLGPLGVTAVAAGGLAILLHNQIRTMCVGIVTPVGNLVAGAAGRHERSGTSSGMADIADEVGALVAAALAVATVVGVVAALVLVGLGLALPWFGQDPTIAATAFGVMAALAPGLLAMLWMNVLRQVAVGLRRAGSLLGVTVASVGVNVLLDGAFLYGWFGAPVLGPTGVGVATSFVQLFVLVVYGAVLWRDPQLAPLLVLRRPDRARVREILRLGAPVGLTYGSEAGITSVATLLMGVFGPVALAAHTVVNQIAYIVYQVHIGLSQASSILVSRTVGRREPGEARGIARRALAVVAAVQAPLAVAYLAAPALVLGPFLGPGDPAVVSVASTLLAFAVLQQLAKGTQNLAGGLMRGFGDTAVAFRASLVGYWAVGVPAMLLGAVVLGWSAPGVWLGLCCGFGATAALLFRAFAHRVRATAPDRPLRSSSRRDPS